MLVEQFFLNIVSITSDAFVPLLNPTLKISNQNLSLKYFRCALLYPLLHDYFHLVGVIKFSLKTVLYWTEQV